MLWPIHCLLFNNREVQVAVWLLSEVRRLCKNMAMKKPSLLNPGTHFQEYLSKEPDKNDVFNKKKKSLRM